MGNQTVTKDTLIGEVLWEYPQLQEVMIKHFGEDVACVMCPGQSFDTFGMIADLHGIDDAVVEVMLKEMNEVVRAFIQANQLTA